MTSITQVLNQSVVVFSQNYLPMNRINIKRAIALLVSGKAEPLDFNNGIGWPVRSPSLVLYVPEQIRLTMASQERLWKVPSVNRKEVLKRDHHRCQYCGTTHNLTLDHVIPRSKGGKNSWDNVVTACQKCNAFKGSRTPAEAGMKLLHQPKTPIHPTLAFAEQFWGEQQHKV